MLNIPGYTFPVEEYMMEDVVEMTGYATYVFVFINVICGKV